jgi:hypothetical protein
MTTKTIGGEYLRDAGEEMLAPKPYAMAAPSFTCRCTPEYDMSMLLVALAVMRFFLLDPNNDALLRR